MKPTPILLAAAISVLAGAAAAQHHQGHGGGQARWAEADANSDGRISRDEFVEARLTRMTAMDTDRNGVVTREEMQAAMAQRRAQTAERRFDRLDANDDGAVSRDEFQAQRAHGAPRPRAGHRRRGGHRPEQVTLDQVRANAGAMFARMDVDNDGFLTEADRAAIRAVHGEGGEAAGTAEH